MEALDNAIAELFYAENLPDELAESPHACTSSSTLHGRRQLHTSHQSGVGLSSFAARGEWWSVRATVRNLRAHSGLATRALARGCAARAAATDRWNAAVRQTLQYAAVSEVRTHDVCASIGYVNTRIIRKYEAQREYGEYVFTS